MNVTSRVFEVQDAWEWIELAYEKGWTDGLPVCPPTHERVSAMLEHVDRDPQEVLGYMPPKGGKVTVEKVAINAVMAGCKPEYLPVVIAATEAVLTTDDKRHFNLKGVLDTTNPVTPLIIVSGPIVERLGFHYHHNAFGGGNGARANATIGRALRLLIWNASGARPGETDMTHQGHPGKYSYCIAENPRLDENPWTRLNVEWGYPPDTSTVTVFGCEAPRNIACNTAWHAGRVRGEQSACLSMLRFMADSMATPGANNGHAVGQILVAFGPKSATLLNKGGYTKEIVRDFLFEEARINLGYLVKRGFHNLEHENANWKDRIPWFDQSDPGKNVPIVEEKGNIHIVVTGAGNLLWNAICHGWGQWGGYAVARPIPLAR